MSVEALVATAGTQARTRRADGLLGRAARHPVRALLVLLAVGMAARVVLATQTAGNAFDLDSWRMLRTGLVGDDPLGVYALNYTDGWQRWPYPAGFFPLVLLSDAGSGPLGVPFVDVLRMVLSLGDVGLALLTWAYLRRTASEERALVAAALILLGPSFMVISAHHGQLDAFAWLPAIAAYVVWQTPRFADRRALYAGLLIGVGIAFKTIPGLMLLALLPSARNRREVVTICLAAGALPLLSLVPFYLGDPYGVKQLTNYHGVPGIGGVSLLIQPDFAVQWLQLGDINGSLSANRLNEILLHHGGKLTGVVTLTVFGVLAWRRAAPPVAALALVLTVWVFGINFLIAYAVWGLAVLLITNRLREAALLQAAMLIPTLMVYGGRAAEESFSPAVVYLVYVPIMLGLLGVFAVWWLRIMWPLARPLLVRRK